MKKVGGGASSVRCLTQPRTKLTSGGLGRNPPDKAGDEGFDHQCSFRRHVLEAQVEDRAGLIRVPTSDGDREYRFAGWRCHAQQGPGGGGRLRDEHGGAPHRDVRDGDRYRLAGSIEGRRDVDGVPLKQPAVERPPGALPGEDRLSLAIVAEAGQGGDPATHRSAGEDDFVAGAPCTVLSGHIDREAPAGIEDALAVASRGSATGHDRDGHPGGRALDRAEVIVHVRINGGAARHLKGGWGAGFGTRY